LAEEKRLEKELRADFSRVWGEPSNIDEQLRGHEKEATAQGEIAIRIGKSILPPASQEILLEKQKQKMQLWMNVIEDW
jgi:hypothetical protein